MQIGQERRKHERIHQNLPISFVYSDLGKYSNMEGKMIDYSRGGMCFESNVSLESGANIYIRPEISESRNTAVGDESLTDDFLAKVVWSKVVIKKHIYFRYGVEYQRKRYAD